MAYPYVEMEMSKKVSGKQEKAWNSERQEILIAQGRREIREKKERGCQGVRGGGCCSNA